jgi:hypothetical protein
MRADRPSAGPRVLSNLARSVRTLLFVVAAVLFLTAPSCTSGSAKTESPAPRLEPAASAGDVAQRIGRGPRYVDPVQWTVGGVVGSLTFHRLYNTERRQHLGGPTGRLRWENTPPGQGRVFFDNCTRAGETIYGSDLVALRLGDRWDRSATYMNHRSRPVLVPSDRSCEFRLIPSGAGLVPAGSGNGNFALYNTRGNRYLVYAKDYRGDGELRWQEPSNRRPPGGVSARADFVPTGLLFTDPETVYLTIRNIGNVRSSASQNEMEVRINGQTLSFIILPSIPPGGYRQNPLRYEGGLCTPMVVEIDTSTKLKFQVGRGAFPNDDVFANDRTTISPQFRGSARPQRGRLGVEAAYAHPPCRGGLVTRR